MAYSKTYKRKSYRRKAKKTWKKPFGRKRMMRKAKTFNFVRKGAPVTVQGSAANPFLPNGSQFRLEFVTDFLDIKNLFEYYKLNCVVMKFYLRTVVETQASTTGVYPKLWYYRNHLDVLPAFDLNQFRQRMDSKQVIMDPRKPISIKIKPSTLDTIWNTSTTEATIPKYNTWIPTAAQAVPHYGLTWAIENFTNTNYFVDIEHVYYFSAKDPK